MNWSKRYLPIFALFVLAISQPLFDLFSKNIEFFVAWKMGPLDIVYTMVLIYILLPILAITIVGIIRAVHKPTSEAVEIVFVFTLLLFFIIQQLKLFDAIGANTLLLIACAIALLILAFFLKKPVLKKFLIYFAVLSPLFPAMFVYQLYAAGFYGAGDLYVSDETSGDRPPPIVMIVFDELPLITLLDKKGLLDDVRFPAISALAREGVWYPKAESAGVHTTESIPALMSGTLKEETTLPNFNNYPINIFSLLGGKYDLIVTENGTSLCPSIYCEEAEIALDIMWPGIAYDIGLTYLHVITPLGLDEFLPQINHKLNDFGSFVASAGSLESDIDMDARISTHNQFLQKIKGQNSNKPALYFYHNLIPHYPWIFSPSGKKYTTGIATPGLSKEQWSDNQWHTVQGYQRHIFQTMYADKMLGEIITALKEKGVFDDALIIFTSDHGVGFWPNSYRRLSRKKFEQLDETTAKADFLSVPLIVKYPKSSKVGVSDSKFPATDIIPTVAEIAKVKVPPSLKGKSQLGVENLVTLNKEIGAVDLISHPSLLRKITLFGDRDIKGLYKAGVSGSKVGTRIEGDEATGALWGRVLVANAEKYNNLDLSSSFIPLKLSGEILGGTNNDKKPEIQLFVAINNEICGSTQTYYGMKKNPLFDVILPIGCFKSGANQIKILQRDEADAEKLLLVYTSGDDTYGVRHEGFIRLRNGDVLKQSDKAIQGSVDSFSYSEETGLITTWGWAADIKAGEPADYMLYSVGEKVYFGSDIFFARKPLAKYYKNDNLTISGFSFTLSESLLAGQTIEMIPVMKNGVYGSLSMKKFSDVFAAMDKRREILTTITGGGVPGDKVLVAEYENVKLKSVEDGQPVLYLANKPGLQVTSTRSIMDGYLDWLSLKNGELVFEGWAVDLVETSPASSILIFKGEELVWQVRPTYKREGVVKAYNAPALLASGFIAPVPLDIFRSTLGDIRVIAMYKDKRAFELHIKDPIDN
ncbi:sulfatase-like hydrolase/transferase [Oceanicoccus sagamiensis]|uniref:Sulfatase N-terminal domain-containing protein n=1 Tax=Oceanicoccus sagamiensis TaxID=716816 RepID=A0A1X9NG03_9GAMM|nr:sulfatase-like hydrolase/transferase [Oceanicoccus sagamiensis]ARN73877.1 hypothetical protein BST96_06970 [Oceanicoccus sagamiensis]